VLVGPDPIRAAAKSRGRPDSRGRALRWLAWWAPETRGGAVTIAVTTPTGNVGSHVARMLCQAGVRPRLLLRNPDRLDADLRDRVELAVGDQRDADYVAESTRGADA